MKRFLRISVMAAAALVAGTAFGGVQNVEPADFQGHHSSLRATVTLTDASVQRVTIRGIGCTTAMYSRVRAVDANSESVWLDGLTSVHDIVREGDGVAAVFTFKNGSERRSSIRAGNRVLYLARLLGRTEQLDLANVTRITFE